MLLLAGCAQAPDVAVSVYQTRSDVPLHRIEIQVRNDDDHAVTVHRAELVSTQLTQSPVWDEPVDIPVGAAMDLKVQLPPALCTGEVRDEVVLTVDGEEMTVAADDRLGQLAAYRKTQCFSQLVQAAGDVRVTGLRGDRLQFDTGVEIRSFGSTTLFVPTELGSDSVRLTPNRCDAHALAEDKQGTYFPVAVTIDGRTGEYTIGVDPQLRNRLYALYARMCGL